MLVPRVLSCICLVNLVSCLQVQNFAKFEAVKAPNGWARVGSPPKGSTLRLSIFLKAANPNALEKELYEVTTPGNSRYGQYLTYGEMASLTRASNEGISTVVKWLNLTGATNIETSPARDNILFTTTVERAGSMMNTEFLEYRHADTDTTKVRTTRIDLPQAVAPYIQSMHPTTFFDRDDGPGRQFLHAEATSMEPAAGSALFQCSDTGAKHKPEDLANRYSMPPQPNSKTPNPDKTGRFGVVGFNDYFPRFRDVQSFKEAFKISPNAFYGSLGINGGVFNESSTTDPSEGNGDIQVTLGLTHSSVFNIFYLAGGTLKNDHPDHQVTADLPLEPWSEFLDSMLKIGETAMQGGKNRWTNGLPHTLSISFGENEQNIPKSYAEVVCNKFARLGSMGVSILAASGDYQPTTECETNGNPSKTWLIPAFPAGCPAITSVGATHVEGNEEIGADFSAGGFSDYFPRPDYQKNHRGIDNYLKSQSAVSLRSWYNPNGRAYPDVSAVGTDIWMLSNRKLTNFCGASASAPVFASAIALLNAKRLEDNKAPLGFLNPWLYKEGDAMLRDITRGNAVGCRYHRSNAMLRNLGTWKSTPGWDAVTGLGVPRYDKMVQRLP